MFNLIPWKKSSAEVGRGDGAERESHPLARFRDEFDNLLERFWQEFPGFPGLASELAGWRWGAELVDEEKEFVWRAEAPGFEPEDFDIQVRGNQVLVRAERKQESKDTSGGSYRYGSLHRSFTLPAGVAQDEVEARYHSGVLEIHLPKIEAAAGQRIAVKTE